MCNILAIIYVLPQAEELIKEEMITMLHYDAVHSGEPPGSTRKGGAISQAQHLAYLEQHPYHDIPEETLEKVSSLIHQMVTFF